MSRLCLLFVLSGAAGCWGSPSANKRLNTALQQSGVAREDVFPFAGNVTIDGQPPSADSALVVMLNDQSKADAPAGSGLWTECGSEGKFSFTTYTRDDGVPGPKTYVVTFAQLRRAKEFRVGPDQLENRYNDPDKNAKNPEFTIVHKARGKTDYAFNLNVTGEPPGSLGPRSFTQLK
jgi:hypothetical protein